MTDLELIRQKCIEANLEIVVNKNAQLIHYDHSVEYFEEHRPIRLADILLTIGLKGLAKNYAITDAGQFFYWDEVGVHYIDTEAFWNLFNDSLNDQTKDTIKFLAQLLK